MDNIEDLKTDASIAYILQKLKETKPVKKPEAETDKTDKSDKENSLIVPVTDIPVNSFSKKEFPVKEVQLEKEPETHENSFADNNILPWFSKSDKDLKLIHYLSLNDSGYLVHNSIKVSSPANDIASLKLKNNYVCDVDYYKSRHYVLHVAHFESNFPYSKTFTPTDESLQTANESAENPELVKISQDDVCKEVAQNEKYFHYVIFTDLGIADFIVRQDYLPFPYGESDLNKWFEESSNYVSVEMPNFKANPHIVSDKVNSIRDIKHDIITMHRPGIITLDSVDNNDSSYSIHLKLKDEFNFIQLNRILGCLKYYSQNESKSLDSFKRFINKYFDIE